MEDFTIAFPFTKVDHSRRIVTGLATADNIDHSAEIVDFNASREAFASWAGNIREMHQPKAVGKTLAYREVQVPYHGRIYDGMEVDVYISKGAPDTWEKVLDGTLRGFSVGGRVLKRIDVIDKNTGRSAERIAKYMLTELSLVDNPDNPAALISMIKRRADGELEYISKYNMYYCDEHNVAKLEDDQCNGHSMSLIGSVDEHDVELIEKAILGGLDIKTIGSDRKVEKLLNNNLDDTVGVMELTDDQKESLAKRIITKFFGSDEEAKVEGSSPVNVTVNLDSSMFEKSATSPGSTLGDELVEKGAGVGCQDDLEKADAKSKDAKSKDDKSKDDGDAEDKVDGGSDEDEEDANGKKVKKSIDGGSEMNDELLKALGALLDEKLTTVKDEIEKAVDEKIDTIQKSVDSATEGLAEVQDKVEKVNDAGALKKSVDDDGSEEVEDDSLEKRQGESGFWGGIFVPQAVCQHLGYNS